MAMGERLVPESCGSCSKRGGNVRAGASAGQGQASAWRPAGAGGDRVRGGDGLHVATAAPAFGPAGPTAHRCFTYLAAAMAMLGPAQNRYADPSAWNRLHEELGYSCPPTTRPSSTHTFRFTSTSICTCPTRRLSEGTQGSGSGTRSGRGPRCPGTNLTSTQTRTPRLLFKLRELNFGTTDGRWPIASTDRGETFFLVSGSVTPRLLVEAERAAGPSTT